MLNKIIVIGNLGADPEMRYSANGNQVTTFNIATTRVFKTAEGEKGKETEWFSVVTWNQLAENCNQYLSKGRRAYVEGRLRSRSWEGPDGQKRFKNEIAANTVVFLDKATTGSSQEDNSSGDKDEAQVEEQGGKPAAEEVDDLPF
jgi:single-strand DNA-binding protein